MDISTLSLADLKKLQTLLPAEIHRREKEEKAKTMKDLAALAAERGFTLEELLGCPRVRQLQTQVSEFIRGCFKKCHYIKVSCSGSRGFVRFKAVKMLACSVLVVDSPVLG